MNLCLISFVYICLNCVFLLRGSQITDATPSPLDERQCIQKLRENKRAKIMNTLFPFSLQATEISKIIEILDKVEKGDTIMNLKKHMILSTFRLWRYNIFV